MAEAEGEAAGVRAALAMAVRAWDAEQENSRRFATRTNLLMTIALAFGGLGAKVVLDAASQHPTGWPFAFWSVGAVGIVLIFGAFVRVLVRTRHEPSPPTASHHLLPSRDYVKLLGEAEPGVISAERIAFLHATMAAYELHSRNVEERKRLVFAQELLLWGAAVAILGATAYTWSAEGGMHGDRGVVSDARGEATDVSGRAGGGVSGDEGGSRGDQHLGGAGRERDEAGDAEHPPAVQPNDIHVDGPG